jgi:hypothetical protein
VRPDYVVFLQAVSAMGAWVAGLIFFRFFRESHDRLFAFFGGAFWLLALSSALLAIFSPTDETRPYIYSLRLVAFALIIFAIIDKNRARS